MSVSEEVQVTEAVMFWVLLSLYVPVAVNCCDPSSSMLALAGSMEMEDSNIPSESELLLPLHPNREAPMKIAKITPKTLLFIVNTPSKRYGDNFRALMFCTLQNIRHPYIFHTEHKL